MANGCLSLVRQKNKQGQFRVMREAAAAEPAAAPAPTPEVAAAERPSMRDVLRQRLMGGEVFETPQREAAAVGAGLTPEEKAEALKLVQA